MNTANDARECNTEAPSADIGQRIHAQSAVVADGVSFRLVVYYLLRIAIAGCTGYQSSLHVPVVYDSICLAGVNEVSEDESHIPGGRFAAHWRSKYYYQMGFDIAGE